MINPSQIRAARGLLDITQLELARRSDVGLATVRRLESSTGDLRVTVHVLLRIQRALESGGIIFIDQDGQNGPGVRLRAPGPARQVSGGGLPSPDLAAHHSLRRLVGSDLGGRLAHHPCNPKL